MFNIPPFTQSIPEVSDKHPETPVLSSDGETLIIGADVVAVLGKPQQKTIYANIKMRGLAKDELSRAAVAIRIDEKGALRAKSLTDNNRVIVWATDQRDMVQLKLRKDAAYPQETWDQLGREASIDITTADGTVIRLSTKAGTSGSDSATKKSFKVEVFPKGTQTRGKYHISEFKDIR